MKNSYPLSLPLSTKNQKFFSGPPSPYNKGGPRPDPLPSLPLIYANLTSFTRGASRAVNSRAVVLPYWETSFTPLCPPLLRGDSVLLALLLVLALWVHSLLLVPSTGKLRGLVDSNIFAYYIPERVGARPKAPAPSSPLLPSHRPWIPSRSTAWPYDAPCIMLSPGHNLSAMSYRHNLL